MDRYDAFCRTTANWVRNATSAQRAAIRQELREHLEDHAAALMDSGMDAEEAAQAAVDAMGDPEKIGLELNRTYPGQWKTAYHVICTLCFLLCLILFVPISGAVASGIDAALQRHAAARDAAVYTSDAPGITPVEATYQVEECTLRVYGMEYAYRLADGDNNPAVILHLTTYSTDLWHGNRSYLLYHGCIAADQDGRQLEAYDITSYGSNHQPFDYPLYQYIIYIDADTTAVQLCYDQYRYTASLSIPVHWSAEEIRTV